MESQGSHTVLKAQMLQVPWAHPATGHIRVLQLHGPSLTPATGMQVL